MAKASDGGNHGRQRLDIWLCNARITKSRTLAQELLDKGKVRVNRVRVEKPSQSLKAGDVITISLGPRVRVLEVLGFAERRGPASVAQSLYVELTPVQPPSNRVAGMIADSAAREPGSGRPTKRDRRLIDRLRGRDG